MADSSRPTASNTLYDNLNKVYAEVQASLSESSISSTATADNLPGPGRLLGNLYMSLGRRLDAAASRFAEKRGYGPEASKKRLAMMCYEHPNAFHYPITPIQGTMDFKRSKQEVKRLLKYAKSKNVSNQVLALNAIVDLATHDHVRQMLIELDAARVVGLAALQAEAENCDQLLSPSRKALICLVDVDVNELGKRLLELFQQLVSLPRLERIKLSEGIIHTVRCLLDKAQRQVSNTFHTAVLMYVQSSLEVSFLAFRYIESVTDLVFRFDDAGLSWGKIITNALLYVFDHAPSAIEWSVFNGILLAVHYNIKKPTEENIESVRVLAARSLGNKHDSFKKIHRRLHPEMYLWESRTSS